MDRPPLGRYEVYLPIIPILICVFIFMGADCYPATSPEKVGLEWRECRISEETYMRVSNPVQAERCFHHTAEMHSSAGAHTDAAKVTKPFFVSAIRSSRLGESTIFLGKIGVKYFIMFNGDKIGPTFDDIILDEAGEATGMGVLANEDCFIFRGVRDGGYYLVEISRQ